MKRNLLLTLAALLLSVLGINAQVTSQPSPLQEDSKDVVIYFHADQGNKGLAGAGPQTEVYAHTGACLSNGKDWVNAPKWLDNSEKYKLSYVSENLWKLDIGDIREYYGITDPSVQVTRLAFVFRNANGSKEGKGTGNSDIFIDVLDSGLQIALTSTLTGNIITPDDSQVTFTVTTTEAADITLTVNGETIGAVQGATGLEVEHTFTEPGNYTVTATATAGGKTATASQDYLYAGGAAELPYPGNGGIPVMGPVKNPDGSVTFCLGAPEKKNVILVGSWNDLDISRGEVMNYTDHNGMRYFWTTVTGLDNSTLYTYYFLVDGIKKVGDPYARLVLDPQNDRYIPKTVYPALPAYPTGKVQNVWLAVYQGDINDYDWQATDFVRPDQTDLVIYELLFRDFTGTEGQAKGNGTVRQAIEKLPYLKSLGVNAIELLPINEFNGNISWGYNPNFYFAPDKAYGTPDDYKEFIDLCHQNGMAVILDVVFNQSDWQHPWYQMYDVGSNPFYNPTAPHAYSVLNDWNQGNEMLQQQWHDMLRYWLTEYRVDGFRFDLVKGLGDNDSYANAGDQATNAFNQSRVDRMAVLQAVVQECSPGAYFINENLAGAKEENMMAESGELNWANVNNAGCQFAMGYSSESNMNRLYAPKDSRNWGSTVSYLESHDEQRLAYKQDQWGVAGVKGNTAVSMQRLGAAAAQMIMAPGSHMIWMFSEMGNAQNAKNSDGGNNVDPKIVNWALLDDPDHLGLMQCYAELIDLRLNNTDLFTPEATANFSIACNTGNWAKGRSLFSSYGGKELYTLINPNVTGEIEISVPFAGDDDAAYSILSKSYGSNPTFSASAKTVTVPANCYAVVGSANVNAAVEGIEIEKTSLLAYGSKGTLVIGNVSKPVYVYRADGTTVARVTADASIALPAGMYIVTDGTSTVKTVVSD